MILYKRNLKNLEAVKAETLRIRNEVKALGWQSPFIPSPQSTVTPQEAVTSGNVQKVVEKEKEETAAKSFTAGTLFSLATNLLVQPAVSRVLSSYIFGKNSAMGERIMQGIMPTAVGAATPKKAVRVVSNILMGFAKWKALELTITTVQSLIQKERKKRQHPAYKAKKKALKAGRILERKLQEQKKKLAALKS